MGLQAQTPQPRVPCRDRVLFETCCALHRIGPAQPSDAKMARVCRHIAPHPLQTHPVAAHFSVVQGNYSDAQWPWEKRAPFICWLSLKGNPYPKKGEKRAPLGNRVSHGQRGSGFGILFDETLIEQTSTRERSPRAKSVAKCVAVKDLMQRAAVLALEPCAMFRYLPLVQKCNSIVLVKH